MFGKHSTCNNGMFHSKLELANIVNWPNLESKMLTAKSQQEVTNYMEQRPS
jgi:hypothetical protein